jgi:hypothetical protein
MAMKQSRSLRTTISRGKARCLGVHRYASTGVAGVGVRRGRTSDAWAVDRASRTPWVTGPAPSARRSRRRGSTMTFGLRSGGGIAVGDAGPPIPEHVRGFQVGRDGQGEMRREGRGLRGEDEQVARHGARRRLGGGLERYPTQRTDAVRCFPREGRFHPEEQMAPGTDADHQGTPPRDDSQMGLGTYLKCVQSSRAWCQTGLVPWRVAWLAGDAFYEGFPCWPPVGQAPHPVFAPWRIRHALGKSAPSNYETDRTNRPSDTLGTLPIVLRD